MLALKNLDLSHFYPVGLGMRLLCCVLLSQPCTSPRFQFQVKQMPHSKGRRENRTGKSVLALNLKNKVKKIWICVILVVVAAGVCALGYVVFRGVLIGLGMAPNLEKFEEIYEAPVSMVKIRYRYKPHGKPSIDIRFKIENLEQIKALQKLFRMKSVGSYSLGVEPDVAFYYYDEKNRPCIWKIRFHTETEILLAKNLGSCSATLTDNVLYQMLLDLAWENNKRLFPNSKRDEIKI